MQTDLTARENTLGETAAQLMAAEALTATRYKLEHRSSMLRPWRLYCLRFRPETRDRVWQCVDSYASESGARHALHLLSVGACLDLSREIGARVRF